MYDYVFLICGIFVYYDLYNLKGKKGYIVMFYLIYNMLDEVNELDDIVIIGIGFVSLDVVCYVVVYYLKLLIIMMSCFVYLLSVRGIMIDVIFKYLIKDKLNDIKKYYFGNVLFDILVFLFLKECVEYDIDFKKLVYRCIGNYIVDLKYDLVCLIEMGIF